jgi:hypothetical protein
VVEEIHRGHRWGIARCPAGEHAVAVWSTPATRLPLVSGYASRSASARTGPVGGDAVQHSFAVVIDVAQSRLGQEHCDGCGSLG